MSAPSFPSYTSSRSAALHALLLCIGALALTAACSMERQELAVPPTGIGSVSAGKQQDQESGGTSGAFSLAIIPADPTRASILSAIPHGFLLADATVRWHVNGSVVAVSSPERFECAAANKGDMIHAVASIQGREVSSNAVRLLNSPPRITAANLIPETQEPAIGMRVEASAADDDGDAVVLRYFWTINGVPSGREPKLDRRMRRGDAVRLEATPSDGESDGEKAVINLEIRNSPPRFLEKKNFKFDGKTYIYQAEAIDPDGDAVVYSLETEAEGMMVQPSNGTVIWQVPPDFKGEKNVTLVARDGYGGIARYPVTFLIRSK